MPCPVLLPVSRPELPETLVVKALEDTDRMQNSLINQLSASP